MSSGRLRNSLENTGDSCNILDYKGFKPRSSKLHRRISKRLGLSRLGFRSERWVGRYRVDELNAAKRLIVEVHGDRVHGNPRTFAADDRLLYGQTADRKWTKDCRRQDYLESRGFRVIVVWESDSIKEKRALIEMALRVRSNTGPQGRGTIRDAKR